MTIRWIILFANQKHMKIMIPRSPSYFGSILTFRKYLYYVFCTWLIWAFEPFTPKLILINLIFSCRQKKITLLLGTSTILVFNTNRVYLIYCNFYPSYLCRTTVIFENWMKAVWKLVVSHYAINQTTETSSKMTSTFFGIGNGSIEEFNGKFTENWFPDLLF